MDENQTIDQIKARLENLSMTLTMLTRMKLKWKILMSGLAYSTN